MYSLTKSSCFGPEENTTGCRDDFVYINYTLSSFSDQVVCQKIWGKVGKVRESKGLNQAQLAEKSGLQPSAVSHFELVGDHRRSTTSNAWRMPCRSRSTTCLDASISQPPPGQPAEKFYRDYEALSPDDQAAIARFADALAKQNESRQSGDPGS